MNTGLELALARLQPVKEEFGAGLSWADLIVLAGTAALEAGMQVNMSRYICSIYKYLDR